MLLHISKDKYMKRANARNSADLNDDLMINLNDYSLQQIIDALIYGSAIIPSELSTVVLDYDVHKSYHIPLQLSQQEIDTILNKLQTSQHVTFKNIVFNRQLANSILPDRNFIFRNSLCWTSQQLFCIEASGNLSELIALANKIGGCSFWYETVAKNNSYCFIFQMHEKIDDYRIAYLINMSLNHYFNTSTSNPNVDLAKIFYGLKISGRHSGYSLVNNYLNVTNLMKEIQLHISNVDPAILYIMHLNFEAKVRLRHININVNNKVIHSFAALRKEYLEKDEYYSELQSEDLGFRFVFTELDSKYTIKQLKSDDMKQFSSETAYIESIVNDNEYMNVILSDAANQCKLIDDFLNNKIKDNSSLERVITNIRYLQNGIRETKNLKYNMNYIWYILSHEHRKLSCISHNECVYHKNGQCMCNTNLYEHIKNLHTSQHKPVVLEDYLARFESLQTCKFQFQDILDDILKKPIAKNDITIINGDNGIGKTNYILSKITNNDVYLLPSHALLREKINSKNFTVSWRQPLLDGDECKVHTSLVNSGLLKTAQIYWHNKVSKYKGENDIRRACTTWEQNQILVDAMKTPIAACNEKLTSLNININTCDTVYIDEGVILSNLIKINDIYSSDINAVNKIIASTFGLSHKLKDKVNQLCIKITKFYGDIYRKYMFIPIHFDEKEITKLAATLAPYSLQYRSNVLSIFRNHGIHLFGMKNVFDPSQRELYTVEYKNNVFKDNVRYVIITSEYNDTIWHKLPGLSNADYKEIKLDTIGDVTLFPRYTYSHTMMNRLQFNGQIYIPEVDYFKNNIEPNMLMVTHKSMIDFLIKCGFTRVSQELYFGKPVGTNNYYGTPLAIIGTPHSREIVYYAFAPLFGLSEEQINKITIGRHKVIRKGCKFFLRTYDNPILREIQLSKIESNLLHMIHACRPIETGAKVHVFSNFLIPGMKVNQF